MAPISPDFGKSLDTLRDRIELTEKVLREHPLAEGQSICVKESPKGDYVLTFVSFKHQGGTLCKAFVPKSENDDDWNDGEEDYALRPLRQLPVAERLEYARWIPELIDAIEEEESKAPNVVKEIADQIEERLARLTRGK